MSSPRDRLACLQARIRWRTRRVGTPQSVSNPQDSGRVTMALRGASSIRTRARETFRKLAAKSPEPEDREGWLGIRSVVNLETWLRAVFRYPRTQEILPMSETRPSREGQGEDVGEVSQGDVRSSRPDPGRQRSRSPRRRVSYGGSTRLMVRRAWLRPLPRPSSTRLTALRVLRAIPRVELARRVEGPAPLANRLRAEGKRRAPEARARRAQLRRMIRGARRASTGRRELLPARARRDRARPGLRGGAALHGPGRLRRAEIGPRVARLE